MNGYLQIYKHHKPLVGDTYMQHKNGLEDLFGAGKRKIGDTLWL